MADRGAPWQGGEGKPRRMARASAWGLVSVAASGWVAGSSAPGRRVRAKCLRGLWYLFGSAAAEGRLEIARVLGKSLPHATPQRPELFLVV